MQFKTGQVVALDFNTTFPMQKVRVLGKPGKKKGWWEVLGQEPKNSKNQGSTPDIAFRNYFSCHLPEKSLKPVKTPNCPSCSEPMKLKKNWAGGHFWGCGSYPRCWGTKDLWDVETFNENNIVSNISGNVTNSKESDMKKLQLNKWYRLTKPIVESAQIGTVRLFWNADMDHLDGKVVKCKKVTPGGWGIFEYEGATEHSHAIHPNWATYGPFDNKNEAFQKTVETCTNSAMKAVKDKKLKVTWETETANDLKNIWDLDMPGVTVTRKQLDEALDEVYDQIEDLTEVNEDLMKKLEMLEEQRDKAFAVNASAFKALEERLQTLESEALLKKPLKTPEKTLTKLGLPVKSKADKDVDRIFRDYHDRNARRDELNERLNTEFKKGKSMKRKIYERCAVIGSTAAIAWSSWTLWPYLLLVL